MGYVGVGGLGVKGGNTHIHNKGERGKGRRYHGANEGRGRGLKEGWSREMKAMAWW